MTGGFILVRWYDAFLEVDLIHYIRECFVFVIFPAIKL